MEEQIVGYHQDEEQHWVAALSCGHFQHVRNDPPWMIRPWVVSEAGRAAMLGQTLNCKKCDRGASKDSLFSQKDQYNENSPAE